MSFRERFERSDILKETIHPDDLLFYESFFLLTLEFVKRFKTDESVLFPSFPENVNRYILLDVSYKNGVEETDNRDLFYFCLQNNIGEGFYISRKQLTKEIKANRIVMFENEAFTN